jgi:hypothetical protein
MLPDKTTNLNNKFLGEAANGIARCRGSNFLTDKSQIKEILKIKYSQNTTNLLIIISVVTLIVNKKFFVF